MRRTFYMLILLTSVAAQASDWVLVAGNGDSDTSRFVDASSVEMVDNLRSAWIKAVYREGGYYDDGHPKGFLKESQSRMSFLCDGARRLRLDSMMMIYQHGDAIPVPTHNSWYDVKPHSIGEALANFVCTAPLK